MKLIPFARRTGICKAAVQQRTIGLFGLVCLSALLAACAPTSKFYSSMQLDVGEVGSKADALKAVREVEGKVIVVRWPAVVVPNARSTIVANDYKWWGVLDPRLLSIYQPSPGSPDFLESASTFFSAELYWAIRRIDPSIVVLLEPQSISLTQSGVGVAKPIFDPSLPVDLVADFWARSE